MHKHCVFQDGVHVLERKKKFNTFFHITGKYKCFFHALTLCILRWNTHLFP